MELTLQPEGQKLNNEVRDHPCDECSIGAYVRGSDLIWHTGQEDFPNEGIFKLSSEGQVEKN